jgi:N-acetyl-gamma-glutamylphosphate reductase
LSGRIDWAAAPNEATKKLLSNHPFIQEVRSDNRDRLAFQVDTWSREIVQGCSDEYPSGLIELMDNNPVVCADRVGLPCPAGTLALIAIGPLVQAGILLESPTMMTNAPGSELDIAADLRTAGWAEGVTLESVSYDLKSVYAAGVIASIETPADLDEIDDLYDERFARSFFVRRDEKSNWDVSLIESRPHAVYRLRISPGDDASLLTIQLMADRDGKCGAAQYVHAMNVMCGFEESLGIV